LVLLFFGAKRIPELARGLGRGMYEFRKAADDIKKEIDSGVKSTDPIIPPNLLKKKKRTKNIYSFKIKNFAKITF